MEFPAPTGLFGTTGPRCERCEADEQPVEMTEHAVDSVAKCQVRTRGRVNDTHSLLRKLVRWSDICVGGWFEPILDPFHPTRFTYQLTEPITRLHRLVIEPEERRLRRSQALAVAQ